MVKTMIKIDYDKCINCLYCTNLCPFTVITNKNGRANVENGKFCLECYHCAAACPQDAITFGGNEIIIKKEDVQFPKKYNVNLKQLIMTRRSYRHFTDVEVPNCIIDDVINMTKWVASTKNEHPTKWCIIKDINKINKAMNIILDYIKESGKSKEVLSEYKLNNNVVFGESQCVIIAYSEGRHINPSTDAIIALTTAELVLQSQQIGTCWAGYLTRFIGSVPGVRESLELPKEAIVHGALICGYPRYEKYIHLPKR